MPNNFRRPASVAAVVLLAGVAACEKREDPKATSLSQSATPADGQLPPGHPSLASANPLPAAAKIYLDSGNVAYRAKQYETARRYYSQAAALAPDHGAPWFGIYMVGEVTKNKKLADSALAEVKKRTPQDTTSTMKPDSALLNPHATQFLPKS